MSASVFFILARIKVFIVVLLLSVGCLAQDSDSPLSRQVFDLDIPAMNAADALNMLAEQTDAILLFPYQDVHSHKTSALKGRYDLLEALTVLLEGTSLEGGLSENGAIKISLSEETGQNDKDTGSEQVDRKKGIFAIIMGAFVADGAVLPAVAQDANDEGQIRGRLEEIVVTSRRYEESINDAPLAVNVLDSSYLEDQGVVTFSDALELTPGATWGHYTMAQPGHSLRGIESYNSGNASLESSVQVVVDGVPLTKAFMMSPPVYDVERIEVMRGPQGTTFGRNASLGIAHFVTGRPSQEFSASADASIGERGYFGFGGHINGAVSDTLSARVAIYKKRYDGDLEDEATGAALEGEDTRAIRASALYEPSDTFSAYLKAEHVIDRGQAAARRHGDCENMNLNQAPGRYTGDVSYIPSCDPWVATISSEPRDGFYQNRDMTHLTAEFSWVQGDINFTSITGYQEGEHAVVNDIFSSPVVIQDQHVQNDATVWSTELRIDNHGSDAAIRWLAGVYLLEDEEFRLENNTAVPPRADGSVTVNRGLSSITAYGWSDTSSQALFGEVSFDLGDRTELAIGGRYTNESKDYDFTNECYGRAGGCNFPTPLGALTPGYEEFYNVETDCVAQTVDGVCGSESNPMGIGIGTPLHISKSWDDFSVKASVNHALNDNINVYALYSEAFKSGGYHHDARSVGQFYESVLDPEYVDNFEVGLKGSYDTVRYAVTAFVQEQTDAQSSSLVPDGSGGYLTALTNLGGIEQQGIEFEGTWLVTENLLIGGNFAFYDGELGPGSAVGFGIDADTGDVLFTDVSGFDTGMDNTWVLYAEHTTDLNSGGTLTVRVDNQHRSEIAPPAQHAAKYSWDGVGVLSTTELEYERPAIDNLGASITWRTADEGMTVRLWGENLLDEVDYGGFGPNSGYYFNGAMPIRNHWGRSRVGVDVKFNF